MLSREEKERLVIELTEEHMSIREIAKEVNLSFATIGAIRRRYSGETGGKSTKESTLAPSSKDTQVFKLFVQGKTPIEVAIELDLKSEEVTRLYKQWWQLKGLHQLNEIYEEIGDDMFQFHQTYKFIKNEGYTPRQQIDAADHLDELPLLRSEREQLGKENQDLEEKKQNKIIELYQTNESVAFAKRNLNTVNLDIEVRNEELSRVHQEKRQVENLVASANSSAGYQEIRRIAEATARSILTQNKVMLVAALRALLQALREEPRNELQLLIYGSRSYRLYEPRNGNRPQNYVQLRQALLLESAEQMYNELLTKAVRNTMSSVLDKQSCSIWN